jgi:hypothetical protein
MKKIVRLTESDLVRLIKRVINEQETQGRTSQLAPNDISNFIDRTGNQGCNKPFLVSNNDLLTKFDGKVLKVDVDNDGVYLIFKPSQQGSIQSSTRNIPATNRNIGNCGINDFYEGLFGRSEIGGKLMASPNKKFYITYT